MGASFKKRRLLSRPEAHVLYAAEKATKAADPKWRVMAQVSLGEVLSSSDARAYSAINSKRVDLLIVSRNGDPIAAIEYQGHATTKELLQHEMLLRERHCERLRSGTSGHTREALRTCPERFRG